MSKPRTITTALGLVIVCLCLIAASLLYGKVPLDLGQAVNEWRSGLPLNETRMLSILVNQRLPRTLTALIAGAGLALAGCAFQALLRNPLATPYTLGVAGAGSLGAWTATNIISGGISLAFLGPAPVQVLAFLFASVDVIIIGTLATSGRRVSPPVLLLAGVTMGLLCSAGTMFMRFLAAPERLVAMDHWIMGGVHQIGYDNVRILYIGVIPCMAVLLLQAPKFDQLGFGHEMAAGRGINVPRLQVTTFLTGSLMTAIIVSVVGPIGFVGLIVPHTVRMLTGSRHRILMPASLIAGGAFLCACDVAARRFSSGEFPVGIITTMTGAPFFLYLLMRRKFTDWTLE